jgi:hypothetical protein
MIQVKMFDTRFCLEDEDETVKLQYKNNIKTIMLLFDKHLNPSSVIIGTKDVLFINWLKE